ncbi:MAG: hypothetical protein AMJ73_05585 [candidate division Zixibacteria bacterium SM1_73]|nr:MAG: hypothetical protein AMJ73_05585 [candidate division Zixibacteria bacterium SM1_73]
MWFSVLISYLKNVEEGFSLPEWKPKGFRYIKAVTGLSELNGWTVVAGYPDPATLLAQGEGSS